ncbi:MAG: 50S ribosomal protein L15 [Bacillota bacterium]|nr:50S ribosomal protein L15 [Bacillota bacterium]MDI7249872.1 50S ribosomal protein L15 [Bacillota bacterium]
MRVGDLRPAPGSRKARKRVGRGIGSGHGKTAGRGHKGQKARAGGGVRPGFEGGQMPLQRRMPKRGFTNPFRREYAIVNLDQLNRFADDTVVTEELLREEGLVKKNLPVKVLGRGELERRLEVRVHAVSDRAREAITARGGRVEVVA